MIFKTICLNAFIAKLKRLVESISKIQIKSYNCNIDHDFDRNLITIEDLGNNNGTSVVEEVFIEGRRKKVLKK